MTLHRLLGFDAGVPDPTATAAFYAEMGLVGDATSGWTGVDGGATVRLHEAATRRLSSVTFGCASEGDLATIARRLADSGCSAPASDASLTVADPTTLITFGVEVSPPEERRAGGPLVVPNAPGRVERRNERAPAVFASARGPRRLGHLVIGTPDLAATRSLLVDGLGCKVSDEIDGVIHFLRCSIDHHNIGLVHSPVPLLQHYSWECDDVDPVGHAATALLRVDVQRQVWGLGRHFAGSNFYWYLRDPAGSFVELYSDLDLIDDDAEWEQRGRTEFGFAQIANAWGPNLPTEFIVPADLAELERAWASTR